MPWLIERAIAPTGCPLVGFHSRTVPSSDADARVRPSGAECERVDPPEMSIKAEHDLPGIDAADANLPDSVPMTTRSFAGLKCANQHLGAVVAQLGFNAPLAASQIRAL
jgi:hypothetical protein